ncbi:hypothetical protein EMIHUDRAFT_250852 [Emiliania huxleyi CCMP1516]|uniref:PDZ domain-containing protein n=2 Tax=Emiliania huxleyi TaxID=2903 RepID=A0A0D3HXC4_EMIH1|nr:hypothetical protein EMIHUDRAFT_250852 [Emiliania huxleyi CCMP1516]EOD03659.1 hypothetical protein EMIHUDRAFT_250852 [Emiliania huxleyi CCMP1516]|eukprot:XP_005756088.1 hypothetical protein EMIHUDRAFT_250852 [Emiliania huxleyi CCMP1516]
MGASHPTQDIYPRRSKSAKSDETSIRTVSVYKSTQQDEVGVRLSNSRSRSRKGPVALKPEKSFGERVSGAVAVGNGQLLAVNGEPAEGEVTLVVSEGGRNRRSSSSVREDEEYMRQLRAERLRLGLPENPSPQSDTRAQDGAEDCGVACAKFQKSQFYTIFP